MDKLGDIKILFISCVIGLISSILLITNVQIIVIISFCLFNCSMQASYSALNLLSTKYFHIKGRGSVFALLTVFGRIGAIIAQFIFGNLNHHPDTLTFMLAFLFATLIICSKYIWILINNNKNMNLIDNDEDDENTLLIINSNINN